MNQEQTLAAEVAAKQFEHFKLIVGGHIFFQTLAAAVEFDLFSILAEHGRLTRSQIAGHLNIKQKPARILLLGLTSLGLIKKEGETYTNSAIAQKFLVRGMPGNLINVIRWQHHINYKPLHAFHQALKENKNVGLDIFPGSERTLYERLVHQPALEQIFQDAMEDISVQANTSLAQFVDLSHVQHLVDVGGGNGTNIMTLAKKYPKLRASVFDSASVCEIARKNIKTANLSDRLNAVAGNCFSDPFPKEADCILFCHFFTIWSEKRNQQLLKKCYESLPVGGSVVIFNMMQRDDETGPLTAALGSPYFLTLATGEGMLYTAKEYETWMKEVGFKTVKRIILPLDHAAIIGVKS